MPTTSNFGWTTPADTDLVKDGAAAIRTLGNGIDSSLVDLKGGTTGQILSKASNTDLDYTWIANDQGDITEVQGGTGISVASGTGPVPVVTNTVATTFDAKGDLVVGTGADTFAKLTVGTNGYTLVADSVETTGLKWVAPASGSMTLLSTVSLSSNTTTYSSIPTGYKLLRLVGTNNQSTLTNDLVLKVNNGTTGVWLSGARNGLATEIENGQIPLSGDSGLKANTPTTYVCDIWNYDSSSVEKVITLFGLTVSNSGPTTQSYTYAGAFNSNTAISSLVFFTSSGTLSGTVLVYGVN